ncbi:hypothetical protein BP00DRAFT_204042 [Aspergillus indologenus CBS 114.80]|uniref:Uncharacterized protein n=1 Tax=Aspergillus indologenus CBS 114.80 TaxID=1450541 RepID=A0A2V5I156_9EURO|nr:hypothetical protein BP00DRAFT_204042 [Aspergillus indologenus CBS 114.80]
MFLLTITVLCGAHLIPLVDLISENPFQLTLATCTFMTILQPLPFTLGFRRAAVIFFFLSPAQHILLVSMVVPLAFLGKFCLIWSGIRLA